MLKYDVLCLGSATVDHFLVVEKPLSNIKLGDKVLITSREIHSGGGATNSAVALAKFGLKVKLLTKLGMDAEADYVQKELRRHGLKNIARYASKKKTDLAIIVSSHLEKDRIIYVHKGASSDLCVSDFKRRQLNCRWIYLATLMGKSFQTAKQILVLTKNQKLLFNPSLYLAQKGKKYLQPILSKTNLLVLNKEEAQALAGGKNSTQKLLQKLHLLGPESVVITDGPRKLFAYHQHKIYSLLPPKIKVVHTAGAGDAFTSGFLAGIIKGYSFVQALQLGEANSCSVIQHLGTKTKLLSEAEAWKFIQKYNIKVRS